MSFLNPFEHKDLVKFPCVNCGDNSVKDYIFEEESSINDFQEKDYVTEVDFSTYLRINDIPDNEVVRVYYCDECNYHIGYLPKSGCRYIP